MTVPTIDDVTRLYSATRHPVLIDVPELPMVIVDGAGPPDGGEFQAAVPALYSVTYGIHFALARRDGTAPKVRPLEALWWSEEPAQLEKVGEVRRGTAAFLDNDKSRWLWSAMISQPPATDRPLVDQVVADAAKHKALPALRWLRFARWREGLCAQVMHIGPYADEPATVAVLHAFIAEQGLRPAGRHHEIYLGDPRRCAPERLRTILRQPVEPSA